MSDGNTTPGAGPADVGQYEARPNEVIRAARNASQALEFIRTTEGHLNELTNVLQRMRVLSIQSANGTYSEEDRSVVQIEVDQLTDEISRVADQMNFNKMRMLTDASAAANVRAADELGMTPAKINTPPSLANAQGAWTLRVHAGANTNEALAVNIFAANVANLFTAEGAPLDSKVALTAKGPAPVGGKPAKPVNVMTASDANARIAKIDIAIKAVTDQKSDLNTLRDHLEGQARDAH
ncbi:flagellar basal body protein [Streptosporangium roseum]|uniref:Flagellin n=1 Tax=Streptosporangium roseum (strain ATCC 12428 / DSM 43021 / JCM 3005 / KCTC 9067 / NCIMB 10171 / NRRL 2505 / NI 9100) TaxID=479432 RepID=D2ARS8_STRRD|nr:flagellar basal body protein [Streptosporangium roseum]ACZ84607.1 adenylate kinase [Streptosporangium roseum DSM 43021]